MGLYFKIRSKARERRGFNISEYFGRLCMEFYTRNSTFLYFIVSIITPSTTIGLYIKNNVHTLTLITFENLHRLAKAQILPVAC